AEGLRVVADDQLDVVRRPHVRAGRAVLPARLDGLPAAAEGRPGGAAVPKPEVRSVGKNFGSLRAVSDVSMRVDHGELRAIIGPNGAGKTTFFNLITGFFPPSAGEILLDGQNINRIPAAGAAKRGMGRTFQITEIFPELTVRENVRIAVETGLNFSLRA